ncbi:UNVERIFIED_ORG: DGQHR domain-containing protein [Bacillus proteolyticus]
MDKIKMPSITVKQGKFEYHLCKISSNVLKKISYISRRDEDKEVGFQRLLNKPRGKLIQKYYENNGAIPSPIILSAKSEAELEVIDSNIVFHEKEKSFLIIDGQHRFYAINELTKDIEIPVVIFSGLSIQDEVNLFIDINTNQKGVPSALLLDIKTLSDKENDNEKRVRELFDHLNENSVLKGKLLASSSKPGYISRTAFNEVTLGIFESGLLRDENNNIIFKTVVNYLAAFEKMYEESDPTATLTKTIFFKVAFRLFDVVIKTALTEYENVKVESIYNIIEPLAAIEYQNYTGTNKQTEARLYNEMEGKLLRNKVLKLSAEELF